MAQLRVGFIGLGAMGAPMARNLAKAGLLAAVYNRSSAKADALASEFDVPAVPTASELAGQCDIVVLCVSADADVLEMVDALAPALKAGSIVIDCSTVAAATAREAAARLKPANVSFLDAPVSGGTEGAVNGTLSIMVGGNEATLERARPVLEAMGKRIVHIGGHGAGQATKAVNQIAVAGVNQAVSEALAFADAHGLDLGRVIDAVGGGAAQSWFLTNRGPNMQKMTFPLGFRVKLHQKDLGICRAMAADHGVQLPVVEMTMVHYDRLIEAGHGDEDVSALYRLKHAMFHKG
ncbi:MAG: NAD(P)-dependent oxidoreductase [Xanthomonadaceae bacterium]|nr:NAD(P)-dependent oxidoreductase [Xanthomonadaceae bacterium]